MLIQSFDRIAIPVFVLDKEHRIVFWNKAIEAMSGLSSACMIGTRDQWRCFYASPRYCMADLMLLEDPISHLETLYAGRYRKSDLIENAVEASDYFPEIGGGRWLSFTAAALYDAQGEVCGAIETLVDISEQKRFEQMLQEREQHFRELSITDSLTGLYNVRHLHEQLRRELARAVRHPQGLSLCMLDLDYFKQINDRYGHLLGDRVLEMFAGVVRTSLREADLAFRFGGEEFLLLLPDTSAAEAFLVAERIRQTLELNTALSAILEGSVEDSVADLEQGLNMPLPRVTVSCGITEYRPGDNEKTLIQRADQALYQAKGAGRNRTLIG
ncbi:sensor domain-containing diguanylate cyclase [Nitrincola tapanii]|uniref:diguanylate cyclase n=1 Tax=Nitrincola tapanii TaxID=1708751 RepID=A0A5A9W2B2_9GAMM|nr:GGDEF domain-containing protein [Nitrincola tapanii]KAA0874703.1 sensor domain-containing diguanylate cyclase [Nitrincola tapanii]